VQQRADKLRNVFGDMQESVAMTPAATIATDWIVAVSSCVAAAAATVPLVAGHAKKTQKSLSN